MEKSDFIEDLSVVQDGELVDFDGLRVEKARDDLAVVRVPFRLSFAATNTDVSTTPADLPHGGTALGGHGMRAGLLDQPRHPRPALRRQQLCVRVHLVCSVHP